MAVPVYLSIAADLRAKINDGKLKPGSRLPSEQALQDEYGELFGLSSRVSQNTMRDVIEVLVREGHVEKRPGQGTFILRKVEEG